MDTIPYSSSSISLEALSAVSTINESFSEDTYYADGNDEHSNSNDNNGTNANLETSSKPQAYDDVNQSITRNITNPSNHIQIKIESHESETNDTNTPATSSSQNPILLLICAAGICTCYLYYGIVQERLFSKNSNSDIKNVGNTTTFMLVLSSLTNVTVANLWIWAESQLSKRAKKTQLKKDDDEDETEESVLGLNHWLFFGCAFCFFAAMTASNESLGHVSYPTAVLAKSSKLIPTMVVGYFIEKKSFFMKEWISAALITLGIIIFNLSRMKQQHKAADKGGSSKDAEDSIYGLFLLLFSLAMDGLLAACQNKLKGQTDVVQDEKKKQKEQYRQPKALETMLWTNAYALLFLLPLSIWSGQFKNGIKLMNLSQSTSISSSLSIRQTVGLLNLTAATGQIFIFFTIHFFSSLMCTTITTTRKFLTILLSVWNFGHQFSYVQWFAIFMVFGGLYLGIVSKFIGGKTSKASEVSTKKEV